MVLMGMVAPFGTLFATIPACVGNGALIIIFALCIGQALREFNKVEFTSRENLVVGLSVIIGTGIMFLPAETFRILNRIGNFAVHVFFFRSRHVFFSVIFSFSDFRLSWKLVRGCRGAGRRQ